jgi:hypothetical protein
MPPRHEALGELKRVYGETAKLSEFLEKASDRASNRTSEALFGGFAGALGLAGAFALSLVVPAAAFYIGGPVAVTLGIPLGILAWRGPGRFRQERRIATNRMALNEILERIRLLPPKAPDSVKEKLWQQYISVSTELEPQRLPPPIDGQGSKQLLLTHQPQIALPPPTAMVPPADADAVPAIQETAVPKRLRAQRKKQPPTES